MEKSKAIVLHEALQESQAKQFAAIPADLLEKERELRIDLAHYETEVQKETAEEEQNQQRLQDLRNRFFASTQEYQRLIDRFEKNFPQYYNLKYQTRTAAVEELQKGLDNSAALVEYVVGDSALHIAAIASNAFDLFSLPIDAAFGKNVERFCASLKTVDKEDYLQSGDSLYNFLIRPIEKSIAGKTRLLVIPDGILHYLPFEAIPLSGSSTGRSSNRTVDFGKMDYLIRRYEISYHYSATLFLNQQRAPRGKQQANGFAGFAPVFADAESGWLASFSPMAFIKSLFNYRSVTMDGKRFNELKYSQEEVQTIADMFERQNAAGLGYFHDEASEENFKANASKYKYVHVATHGMLNEDQPELAGIIFSQPKDSAAKEDGVLYSAECYNLDLNADLVVLGSCESGVGRLVKGEGLTALTRGFLYSGARHVIHSLWKVDDKHTSRLMIELYRNILAGKSYSTALRAAKLKLIENEATSFPASWSSFVLVDGM